MAKNVRSFSARKTSVCSKCGGEILPGNRCKWLNNRVVHYKCPRGEKYPRHSGSSELHFGVTRKRAKRGPVSRADLLARRSGPGAKNNG